METWRGKNIKLSIELVPQSCWYNNVRSNVAPAEWDFLRKKSYQLAGHKCEVCGDVGQRQGFRHSVECHEEWSYENGKQTLVKLISLCPYCHKCKHPGLANIKNEGHLVLSQLMLVNDMTESEAKSYLQEAFELWEERSSQEWELNIDYIEEFKNI